MKITYSMIVVLVMALGFGCSKSEAVPESRPVPTQPSPMPAASNPKDGNYNGRGLVTKIDTKLGSIELKHEDIVGVMPAMQMEFYVRDKSSLDGVKVGDNVEFVLEYKHPTETIVSIKKIP